MASFNMEQGESREELCTKVKIGLHDRIPWHDLEPQLRQVSQSQLEKEDEDHLNILHHAIKAGYAEVVHYLFLRGYFMELQQPSCIPYLHLACFYGHTFIVGILLKERPADFKKRFPIAADASFSCPTDLKQCSSPIQLSDIGSYSPLDLAAASRQIRCVQLLLNIGNPAPSLLESAVRHGSVGCVRLLLEDDDTVTQTEVNRAFKLALTRKLAGCLDLLIKHGVQVSEVLNTMNPYHVMYMYSSGYQLYDTRNKGLAECTKVLIESGQDVNTSYPCGSFPLYSLLHSMFEEVDYKPNSPPIHHMKALEYLLEAGANPNMDEESLTDSKYNQGDFFFSFSLGRDPYTSALSALMVLLEQSSSPDGFCIDWFVGTMKLILDYGGNPQAINRYGDTPLHDLMKCLAMQHCMNRINLDLGGVIQLLLKYGADANEPSTNGILPINYYFSLMLNLTNSSAKCEELFSTWCKLDVPKQVLKLLYFMDHDKAYAAGQTILNQLLAVSSEGYLTDVKEYITLEIMPYISQPRRLSFICSSEIWKTLGRQKSNIHLLPIPKGLKIIISDMFDIDLL